MAAPQDDHDTEHDDNVITKKHGQAMKQLCIASAQTKYVTGVGESEHSGAR